MLLADDLRERTMAANKALIEANWARAMNEVYWPKPAPTILPKGLPGFYAFIAGHIGRDVPLDYLEFGVAQGNSMRLISSAFTSPYARFYGFDSFMGLPERWQMHDVGAFSNKGNPPRIDDERVSFVKGWFQNSVPPFASATARSVYPSPLKSPETQPEPE